MPTPTTIKLSLALKKRVAREAKAVGQSSHAFLLTAIERQTSLARARREMLEGAAVAEAEFDDTGRYLTLEDLDRRLAQKLEGTARRRVEFRTWPRSSSPKGR